MQFPSFLGRCPSWIKIRKQQYWAKDRARARSPACSPTFSCAVYIALISASFPAGHCAVLFFSRGETYISRVFYLLHIAGVWLSRLPNHTSSMFSRSFCPRAPPQGQETIRQEAEDCWDNQKLLMSALACRISTLLLCLFEMAALDLRELLEAVPRYTPLDLAAIDWHRTSSCFRSRYSCHHQPSRDHQIQCEGDQSPLV